ncbi:MAG: hypothetical protein J0L99_20295 [Chitinophagales bacterium]|nr:hypothetical protein [Chitinophagales bacterium]
MFVSFIRQALRRSLAILCLVLSGAFAGYAGPGPYTPDHENMEALMRPFIEKIALEIEQLDRDFLRETESMRMRLDDIQTALADPRNRTAERGFELIWEQKQLVETLEQETQEHELKLLKVRYRKSIEVVKMLYEKVLSMDHHFSSLKAQQGLSNLSNPHNYPEFKETKAIIDDKVKKKFGFELPNLLQSNPYLSAAFSIVGLITGSGDEKEKKESIDKIACILDFTVRMHTDLNVIYYETGYLRDANLTLKKECEVLFTECARQVGYTIPLTSCRDGDDWERLYSMLDSYVAKALGENPAGTTTTTPGGFPPMPGTSTAAAPDQKLVMRATTNLQFSIDRVAQFIEKYSGFVGQGSEYYKKFSKIASSYENEKACSETLPAQFKQLKEDIDLTLDKFNSAYRMPEVQGSKLKDMLYGTYYE